MGPNSSRKCCYPWKMGSSFLRKNGPMLPRENVFLNNLACYPQGTLAHMPREACILGELEPICLRNWRLFACLPWNLQVPFSLGKLWKLGWVPLSLSKLQDLGFWKGTCLRKLFRAYILFSSIYEKNWEIEERNQALDLWIEGSSYN